MVQHRKLKICFLKADTLPYEAIKHHGEYEEVLHALIEPLCKSSDTEIDLEISKYDVIERQYPRDIHTYDAVIISGSFADSSVDDKLWVLRLCGFLIMLHDEYPHIRQIGICFVGMNFASNILLTPDTGNANSCACFQ